MIVEQNARSALLGLQVVLAPATLVVPLLLATVIVSATSGFKMVLPVEPFVALKFTTLTTEFVMA